MDDCTVTFNALIYNSQVSHSAIQCRSVFELTLRYWWTNVAATKLTHECRCQDLICIGTGCFAWSRSTENAPMHTEELIRRPNTIIVLCGTVDGVPTREALLQPIISDEVASGS